MSTWKSALLAGAMLIVPAQAFAAPNKEAPVVVFEPSQTKPETIPETEYNSEAAMADAKAKMQKEIDEAIKLIEKAGGNVVGCSFIIDLPELKGRRRLEKMGKKVLSLVEFEGH